MEFLDRWLKIIRYGSFENTYKMAWGKAITEIAQEINYHGQESVVEIPLERIAEKFICYYWDQTIHFDLVQGSNPKKSPEVITTTKKLISAYQEKTGNNKPIKYFRSGIEGVCEKEYREAVRAVVKTLKADVSYRFIRVSGKELEGIYQYKKGDNSLLISLENLKVLKQNHHIIFELINYRWAQILEGFNHSPRICKKVRIIDDTEIRRNSLTQFRKYLDYENPEHICFICGQKVADKNPPIDHVIPWSFLYSDDIWNLVYTHQSCNSKKNNVTPSEEQIIKLEARNRELLKTLESQIIEDKKVLELKFAIESNLVRKFWNACKG